MIRELYEGVRTVIAEEDGKLITGTIQDCDPIAEDAKRRHNAGEFGSSEMKHAARLPLSAIETYMAVQGIDLKEFMVNPVHVKAMCQDPALKDFRIWPGRF